MIAIFVLSTSSNLGFLCAGAGFLIIIASVVFVTKGKALLGDSGAPNTIEWGKIKANLTSAVSLFVLGALMIALPFVRVLEEESKTPATAILKGKITGNGAKDVRLLLVEKPDYDQTYRDEIAWEFPLITKKASYSVFFVYGDRIVHQEPFSVKTYVPGSAPNEINLPPLDLQLNIAGSENINPRLEVSDAELQRIGVN